MTPCDLSLLVNKMLIIYKVNVTSDHTLTQRPLASC